jgi:hypothetical protein
MSKILKILTTSFLILFMSSACNINTSSPNTTNSTISSNSTNTINNTQVSDISLSTNSSIKQFVGLTSKVLITAQINSGSNQQAILDWYVNDEKSLTQNGLLFEVFPTQVGKIEIKAKVGNVTSNVIVVEVDRPSFNVSQVSAPANNVIRVIGEAGLNFQITGLAVSSSSRYNIVQQEYLIFLNNIMNQGSTYNITISKTGFKDIVIPFTYETRKLTVGSISYNNQRVSANADGAFELAKPFTSGSSLNYQISIVHTNLEGSAVPININTSVPAGAVAIDEVRSTINVLTNININRDFQLTSTTVTGLYVHNIIIGGATLTVRVLVVSPTPKIELGTPFIYDLSTITNPFGQNAAGEYIKPIIKPNSLGQYEIFRPYNGAPMEFTFILRADNFVTPLGFPASPANPYNLIVALTGPSGGVMFYGNNTNTLTTSYPFRETLNNNVVISQLVDNKTALGTYTYTFTATGTNTNLSRSVIVLVKEYQPTLEAVIKYNTQEIKANTDGSYTIFKPSGANDLTSSLKLKISNFESPLVSQGTQTGVDTYYESGAGLKYFLNYQVSYSGPLSIAQSLNTKIAVELGVSQANAGTSTVPSVTSTPVSYGRYRAQGSSIEIDLNTIRDQTNYTSSNIFSHFETINANTIPGTHIYTIQLGRLTRRIIFIVQQPTAMLITKDDSVKYGPTLGSEVVENVRYDKKTEKYYVDGPNGYLKLIVHPFGMTTGTYPYSFTVKTPSNATSVVTNVVYLEIKTSPQYDGTLIYPASGQGSEMNVTRLLTETGEYTFSYNINGIQKEVKVVVLEQPVLKISDVKFNNSYLVNFNGAYYINNSTVNRFVELELNAENVDIEYKYVINSTGLFPSGSALLSAKRDLALIGDTMTVGVELPANSSPAAQEIFNYYIMLYKGNVRVGAITKITIITQPIKSTIFFNTRGGSAIQANTKFVGESIIAPSVAPILASNTFVNWYIDPELTQVYSFTTMPSSDIILYAKWTPLDD